MEERSERKREGADWNGDEKRDGDRDGEAQRLGLMQGSE